MSTGPGTAALRPEIASAWRRAELSGLHPGSSVAERDLGDVDRQSRLMLAAAPVLDDVERRLADTRYSVLLADREARIIDRRLGLAQLGRALDAVLAVPGNTYAEETTGTNALAVPFETRGRITVHGEEHFLEQLKGFTCHGSPIVHPVTGRLEGVLDLTGTTTDANPLLGTVVAFAAQEIEKRLVTDASLRHRAMLHAYHVGTGRSRRPIMVFGEDLTLVNDAASDLLDPAGRAALCDLAAHAAARGGGRGRLTPASGVEITFTCHAVDGAPRATYVEIDSDPTPHPVVPRRRRGAAPLAAAARDRRVLVTGEAGTGRTHAAAELAGDEPVQTLDPDLLPGDAERLADLLRGHPGPTVVEHLHLLDDRAVVRLARALDLCPGRRVIATAVPDERGGEYRSLLARFDSTVELRPLRHRRAEIPELARGILADLAAGAGPAASLTPAAVRVLLRWPWPGNLAELVRVLRTAAERRPGHALLPEDLGLDHRTHRARALTPLEEAEAQAIQAALRRARGNKTHAAAELGISRTTVYRRMVALGLAE